MDLDKLEEEAAYWIARRDRGDWTARLEQDLTAWLDHATSHRVTYLRLSTVWEKADALRETEPPSIGW